ncbi:MAG TPA: DsbA family protein [Hyphomicrobiaceae bacterium]|nr:DsbA family protein [Hyphomicrobiaceae bacterium]
MINVRRQLLKVSGLLGAFVVAATVAVMPENAEAQRATPRPEVPVTELMKPGPLPDLVYGKADAPVTIVEYASMTCSACGRFHAEVLPKLKAKYIDTGKARLVIRPFARDNLDAAAWLLTHCTMGERSYVLAGALFDRQQQWAFTPNPLPELLKIGKQAGFTEQAFNACVQDAKKLGDITAIRDLAFNNFGVDSTPAFFINGKRFPGFTLEQFEKAIDPLLPKS